MAHRHENDALSRLSKAGKLLSSLESAPLPAAVRFCPRTPQTPSTRDRGLLQERLDVLSTRLHAGASVDAALSGARDGGDGGGRGVEEADNVARVVSDLQEKLREYDAMHPPKTPPSAAAPAAENPLASRADAILGAAREVADAVRALTAEQTHHNVQADEQRASIAAVAADAKSRSKWALLAVLPFYALALAAAAAALLLADPGGGGPARVG